MMTVVYFFFTNVVKQMVAQEVGSGITLSCSQRPVTGPYPDPDESSLDHPALFI
jgi:hypothetical protein